MKQNKRNYRILRILGGLCGLAAIVTLHGCAGKFFNDNQGGAMLQSIEPSQLPKGVTSVSSHPLGKDFLVQQFEFENGLKVIVMEDHAAPLFAYHTWFKVGSRYERPGITGIAHLFEHLMFKATTNHPDGYFDNTMETHGGNINAGTSRDWTFYHENIPSGNLDMVAALEADRLQNVLLTDAQINTEREVVKEERRFRTDDSIDGQMDEMLYMSAFHQHSYGWPVIGHMKDLNRINLDDCVKFYKTYYAPNNATIVVTGDVKTTEVLATIYKYYATIPAATIPRLETKTEPPQNAEQIKIIRKKSLLDEKLLMGYRVPNAAHIDRIPLQVLNTLLVEGKSSRLYRQLVDEKKIASAVNGSVDEYADPGLYKIAVAMSRGHKIEEAIKVIEAEIAAIQKNPISNQELEKAKNTVEAYFLRVLKTNQYKAFLMGYYQTLFGDYREMFKEIDRFRAVQDFDIKRVASNYLRAKDRTIIIAKPEAE